MSDDSVTVANQVVIQLSQLAQIDEIPFNLAICCAHACRKLDFTACGMSVLHEAQCALKAPWSSDAQFNS